MFRALSWLPLLFLVLSSVTYGLQSSGLRQFEGTVVLQKKYGIVVATTEERVEIAIPSTAPIEHVLTRPKFDWEQGIIRLIPENANDTDENGDANEEIRELPFSKPLYIEGWFAHRSEFERLWGTEKKMLVRYRLTNTPQDNAGPSEDSFRLTGEIVEINERNEALVRLANQTERFRLGDRDAVCSGFSILDLKSDETEVIIDAERIDEQWVAQNIRFRHKNRN